MDGITCTQKVKEIQPHVKVATISGTCTQEKLTAALNAGSDGFLTKDMDQDNLIWAVKEILDNKKPLCDDAKSILANIQLNKTSPKFELSEREMEVGYLLTKGYTLDKIKEVINVSHSTARDYKLRAMEKTNSKNEKCLIAFLVENRVFENYIFPYKLP
jgi:DNA-binding NarL/FixJ family response regulator